jgi:calpain-15
MVLGLPTDIYVDDYLPFYTYSPSTLYYTRQAADGGLWPAFMEKIWSKASGNYEMVEGGWAHEALRFLTGAPTTSYYKGSNWNDFTTAWNIITTADSNKYIMMAGTPGSTDKSQVGNGLAASHAYSLLAAYIVRYANGTEKAKLLLMRNPWGNDGVYNGTWNDNDALWNDLTNNYAKQVPYTKNVNDGLFFITVQDFYTYFSAFSVSYYSDSFVHSTSTVRNDTGVWKRFDFSLAQA